MSSEIIPLANHVVAVENEAKKQTASGIYLPEKSKEKSKIAVVVAIGEGVSQLKQGNQFIYNGFNVTKIKIEGQEYIILKEEDCYAIVKKTEGDQNA